MVLLFLAASALPIEPGIGSARESSNAATVSVVEFSIPADDAKQLPAELPAIGGETPSPEILPRAETAELLKTLARHQNAVVREAEKAKLGEAGWASFTRGKKRRFVIGKTPIATGKLDAEPDEPPQIHSKDVTSDAFDGTTVTAERVGEAGRSVNVAWTTSRIVRVETFSFIGQGTGLATVQQPIVKTVAASLDVSRDSGQAALFSADVDGEVRGVVIVCQAADGK